MKFASWNVNSIKQRLPHVKDWLQQHQPDVLMLQELKGEDFPDTEISALHYNSYTVRQKAYNGVAMISREPLDIIFTTLPGLNDEDAAQARYIEAEYKHIRLINIYLPNGNPMGTEKFDLKIRFMECLYQRFKDLRTARVPFFVCGDFNIIPTALDAANINEWLNDALYSSEARAYWQKYLNLGLYDAYRSLHPDTVEYTFWDYQAGSWQRNNGIRIDHFLLSPPLADRVQSCFIDKAPRALEKASDHTPIVLEIA